MKWLWILLFPLAALGQASNPQYVYTPTNPNGLACTYLSVAYQYLGNIYTCSNGSTYTQSSAAGGPFVPLAGGASNLMTGPLYTPGIGTIYYVDGFPSSCTVNAVAYTTQYDCAKATAIQNSSCNWSLMMGVGTYLTNTSTLLAPVGSTNTCGGNLFGAGKTATVLLQNASISTGTVYLPIPGSSAGLKTSQIENLTIDANNLAPYALQYSGQSYNSNFSNLVLQNGTTGNAIWGVDGNSLAQNDNMTVQGVFGTATGSCTISRPCARNGALAVSLSGGAPVITVTNGGTGYDSNTQGWLVGYQSGTSLNPCTNMQPIVFTISVGGAITGATSASTGCTGAVYADIDDESQQFGLDFDYVTDSQISLPISTTGYEAGILVRHGNNHFVGAHSYLSTNFTNNGKFGVENYNTNSFYGTDMGEVALAEFDNHGTIAVEGAHYFSGIQVSGSSMFRNEIAGAHIYAQDVDCGDTQSAEYHTLADYTGAFDFNSAALIGTGHSLHNIAYCGSGSGFTIWSSPSVNNFNGLTSPYLEALSTTASETVQGGQDASANAALGSITVRGADQTGAGGGFSAAGGLLLRGGNNAATNANSLSGGAELITGASTGASTPGINEPIIVGRVFKFTGTFTQWALVCATSTLDTVQTCSGSQTVGYIGVAFSQPSSTTALVALPGSIVPVSAHSQALGNAACLGGFAGQISTNANGCGISLLSIGTIVANSGTYTYPDGTSATLSSSLVLVALSSSNQGVVASARKGIFVCTNAGTITISNTLESATSDVVISMNAQGGTITTPPAMKTVTAGTGFTVLCGVTDTSTYNYDILN
jgi:hypothetical protein